MPVQSALPRGGQVLLGGAAGSGRRRCGAFRALSAAHHRGKDRMSAPSIVVVRDLVKMFAAQGALLRAVDGVSFDVRQSETLGLVGESGSGKSTTGRILVGLEAATSGSIKLFGQEISTGGKAPLGAVRRRLQSVFHSPPSSLNPPMPARISRWCAAVRREWA